VPKTSWQVRYTEANPNPRVKSATIELNYAVVGMESVEVPAGRFLATKIEAQGLCTNELLSTASNVAQGAQTSPANAAVALNLRKTPGATTQGNLYKAIWYVPEIKRWVKSVEEFYDAGGNLSERQEEQLESSELVRRHGAREIEEGPPELAALRVNGSRQISLS
jgi:hypothetical protein